MRKFVPTPLFSSLLFLLALFLALAWQYERTAPQRIAREIWQDHEQVVNDAAQGKSVNLTDFSDAALFFGKLTGIDVPGDHSTYIDWMPNKDTATAVEPLRRWYAENKDRLYWDDQMKRVRLSDE